MAVRKAWVSCERMVIAVRPQWVRLWRESRMLVTECVRATASGPLGGGPVETSPGVERMKECASRGWKLAFDPHGWALYCDFVPCWCACRKRGRVRPAVFK